MSKSKRTARSAPTSRPRRRPEARAEPWRRYGGAAATAVLAILAVGILVGRSGARRLLRPAPSAAPTPGAWLVGSADDCRASPRFLEHMGLGDRAAISTSDRDHTGLVVLDPDGKGGQGSVYQHPSWDDAGHLGPFATDRFGNLYTAATPLADLATNRPSNQNRIYRIDTDSQEMTLYLDLPAAGAMTEQNPYGVVGLAYDCDTESLYATSLAGSTEGRQVGRIYQVDLRGGQVAAHYDNVDAVGVAVFNGATGKRLYFGPAISAEVRSIALDGAGHFVGDPRRELALSAPGVAGAEYVQRIRFRPGNEMELQVVGPPAATAAATTPGESLITFQYNPASDTWSPTN